MTWMNEEGLIGRSSRGVVSSLDIRHQWKRQLDRCAFAYCTLHRNLAAVRHHQVLGDGKPQARTARIARFVQAVEDMRQFLRRDAFACVGYIHSDE